MENQNKALHFIINEDDFFITFSDQEALFKIERPFEAVVDFFNPNDILIFFSSDTDEFNVVERRNKIHLLVKEVLIGSCCN